MTRPLRFLGEHDSSSDSPDSAVVDSDFVVILAALLCALICVLGLVLVARCSCLRRLRASSSFTTATTARPTSALPPSSAANKGLKKKILRSLPILTVTAESSVKHSDCAICLAEITVGDEIRVLPQCGHGFHVCCIDAWLRSHSSCPSCRQILQVVSRCDKCGGIPRPGSSSATAESNSSEARFKAREDDVNRFLP